jgi:hypothetical protein
VFKRDTWVSDPFKIWPAAPGYLRVAHYYGAEYLTQVRPGVITDDDRLREEINRLAAAGADALDETGRQTDKEGPQ